MKSKDLAMIILGKGKKQPSSEMEMEEEIPTEEESELDEGYLAAAEEVMSALQSGNAEEFAKALKSAISLCM